MAGIEQVSFLTLRILPTSRIEVLGAFFSVVLIWVVTAILVYLAIQRIVTGEYEIDATVMAITAAVGVGVNILFVSL